ncbi:hypothetical protein ElyMa_002346100 [Elysia marginata]|uniref:Uncharacterized protein n=1 Tax=Elysia marginata TaxID=1093978 RepID=A0AAV4GAT0_9GAST|nr:hypothetical protein ElyMa_002346100 [Elysia marginata]
MAQPRTQDAVNWLDRQDESLFFQIKTQHTRTTVMDCGNAEHLLLLCPYSNQKRTGILLLYHTIHGTLHRSLKAFIRLGSAKQQLYMRGVNIA